MLYAAYAGQRRTAPLDTGVIISINGSIGNIGIPSKILARGRHENYGAAGESTEPYLVVANSTHGFLVAIPEDSTELTHTLQIFKFV